jgi:hypothetical protein
MYLTPARYRANGTLLSLKGLPAIDGYGLDFTVTEVDFDFETAEEARMLFLDLCHLCLQQRGEAIQIPGRGNLLAGLAGQPVLFGHSSLSFCGLSAGSRFPVEENGFQFAHAAL